VPLENVTVLVSPGVPPGSVVGPSLGLVVIAIILDLVSDVLVVVAASAGAAGAARVVAAANLQLQGGGKVDRLALALTRGRRRRRVLQTIKIKSREFKKKFIFCLRICRRRDQD
jgi:hypothetical protein